MLVIAMEVKLDSPGTYILAVSGGIDSMVLLDLLNKTKRPDQTLIIAHLDHGIRVDSNADRKLVENTAMTHGLVFEYKEVKLGPSASEAEGRQARYDFFNELKTKHKARAVVTAHHQDDLIETAILNMIRGTNRKGLSSLKSRDDLIRPLLEYSKDDLINYARDQGLTWHEDSTNQDTTYLRNYIRHKIVPRLDNSAKTKLIGILNKASGTNTELDKALTLLVGEKGQSGLDRQWFISLPHNLAREVMATWLRLNKIEGFDALTLERLVVQAKVATAKVSNFPIKNGYSLEVRRKSLALKGPER
jgi:tRNA(Ile)-lysidine synthetase-like protein